MRRSRLPLSRKSGEAALLELLAAAAWARIVATDVAKRIDRRLWHVHVQRCALEPDILVRIVRMRHPVELGQEILDVAEPLVRTGSSPPGRLLPAAASPRTIPDR